MCYKSAVLGAFTCDNPLNPHHDFKNKVLLLPPLYTRGGVGANEWNSGKKGTKCTRAGWEGSLEAGSTALILNTTHTHTHRDTAPLAFALLVRLLV